jgi:hypothetical protein
MIAQDSSLRWPSWHDVLDVWNVVCPPDVEIIPFVIGTHRSNMPWLRRKTSHQTATSSAQDATAYHLCVVLPRVAPECLAAYKIHACCREREAYRFTYNVIEPIFQAHGLSSGDFWTGGTKILLPDLRGLVHFGGIDEDDVQAQLVEWPTLVKDAAAHWSAVANEWALVRIPRFLDRSSAE